MTYYIYIYIYNSLALNSALYTLTPRLDYKSSPPGTPPSFYIDIQCTYDIPVLQYVYIYIYTYT